jgi:hypothetical protein
MKGRRPWQCKAQRRPCGGEVEPRRGGCLDPRRRQRTRRAGWRRYSSSLVSQSAHVRGVRVRAKLVAVANLDVLVPGLVLSISPESPSVAANYAGGSSVIPKIDLCGFFSCRAVSTMGRREHGADARRRCIPAGRASRARCGAGSRRSCMDRACAAACRAVRVHMLQLRGSERRLEWRRLCGRLTITAEQAAGRVRPPAGVHRRRRPAEKDRPSDDVPRCRPEPALALLSGLPRPPRLPLLLRRFLMPAVSSSVGADCSSKLDVGELVGGARRGVAGRVWCGSRWNRSSACTPSSCLGARPRRPRSAETCTESTCERVRTTCSMSTRVQTSIVSR